MAAIPISSFGMDSGSRKFIYKPHERKVFQIRCVFSHKSVTNKSNPAPVRKRIRAPVSDSSDDDNETRPAPKASTVKAAPARNGATQQNPTKATNGSTLEPPKEKKSRRKSNASEQSDDNEYQKGHRAVYESDDNSDDDAKPKRKDNQMTKGRQIVFDFVNDCKPKEFLSIKTFTQKKVDLVVAERPFKSWYDLVVRIKTIKGLTPDILNSVQEYLNRRNNISKIMKKCTKIVSQLETAVDLGGGIVKQPTILNPAFKLADYQMIGLNWLTVMDKEEMNGILADEMGLGKTIQVIALLAWLKETGRAKGAHLIVVPSSTLENWALEFER